MNLNKSSEILSFTEKCAFSSVFTETNQSYSTCNCHNRYFHILKQLLVTFESHRFPYTSMAATSPYHGKGLINGKRGTYIAM